VVKVQDKVEAEEDRLWNHVANLYAEYQYTEVAVAVANLSNV
jgi:hypothetical protein